ncbi:hypothetical protein F5Y06DRAFT_303167 [Hypoxylon sp. FL0890]|nr:hypothetical protein F5Y06DRAFT_303167 [Hypoxylon sp. FL0890]
MTLGSNLSINGAFLEQKKEQELRISIQLHVNDEYTDVEVTCGGRQWRLHRMVLCQRSSWFKAAFNGSFMEASGKIDIREWSPDLIEGLVTYIYEGECIAPSCYDFVSLIELWQLGDYFLVPNMCDDALKKLRNNLEDAALELLRFSPNVDEVKGVSASKPPIQASTAPQSFPGENTITEILTKFRAGISRVYLNSTSPNHTSATTPETSTAVFQEIHPIRSELAQFYARVGFQYHADPRWGLGSYIDNEVPGFGADVLRNLFNADGKLKLWGLPKNCSICRSALSVDPRNKGYKAVLCSAPRDDAYDIADSIPKILITSGLVVAGSEIKCEKCTTQEQFRSR